MNFKRLSVTLVRGKDESFHYLAWFFPPFFQTQCVQTDTHTLCLEKDVSLIAPFKIAGEAEAKQYCDKSAKGPIAAGLVCCRSLLSIKPIR